MVEDSTADDHESAILCSLRHLLPDFLSWEAPSSSTLTNSLASSLSSLSSIHLLVLALGILVPVSVRSWCKTRDRKNLPGPWSFPVFGHVTSLCSTPHLTLTHLHRQYGDIYKVKVGRYEVVVVGGMEGVREGLVERASTLSARPAFQNFAHLYDEEEGRHRGLCTADNTEKHVVRKAFLTASIDAYCSDTRHIEDKLGSEIIDTVSRLIDKEGDIDPHEPLKAACLNIIFRLVFNQQFDPQGGLMRETLTTLDNRVDMLAVNPIDLCPLWKLFNTDEHASLVQNRSAIQLELQNKFINLHKDSYDREHIRDMADHLLLFVENADDFGLLTKEDIDYLLLDVVTFGYQSIAVTLTWLLGYMASDLEFQRKVHKEIDHVVGRDRLPGLDDQPYLPLTTAAILETLRLASVHPFLYPHAASEDTTIQGYHIPRGCLVLFNVWNLHHSTKYWRNPHKYDPTRFLSATDQSLEIPDQFHPYGAGVRQCPGEGLADVALFLFFATIMHQSTVFPRKDATLTLCAEGNFLLRPKPFCVRVEERGV